MELVEKSEPKRGGTSTPTAQARAVVWRSQWAMLAPYFRQQTGSELEVLRALMQSTSDEDAANRLGCSKANVRWHVSKILEKTGYRTRMELLIAVAQKNLIIVTPDKGLDDTI